MKNCKERKALMTVNDIGMTKFVFACLAIISSLVMPLAEAGIAACYTGKVNTKGEYSDSEYHLLSDGVNSGRTLAGMIRKDMRNKGIKVPPLCTMAQGSGFYTMAVYEKDGGNIAIYALGLNLKSKKDSEVNAAELIATRNQTWKSNDGYRVIQSGQYGPARNSSVKIHCSVDKSASIQVIFKQKGNILIGQYNSGGITVTLNHGNVSSLISDDNEKPSFKNLGKLIPRSEMRRATAAMFDAACGTALTPAIKRSVVRSLGDWFLDMGYQKIKELDNGSNGVDKRVGDNRG